MPKKHSSSAAAPSVRNDQSASSAHEGIDERRATKARGHDDQGGSRQSEARDYERAQQGGGGRSESSDTGQTHSDGRHARERYGEQTAAQQRDSAQKEQPENLGGQDSRDQSPKDKHSLLGRSGRPEGEREDIARRQRESAGIENASEAEPEPYASETREKFSREYAEHQRREAERRGAAGGGDYDGNWTKDTDKPSQPGPAGGGAG